MALIVLIASHHYCVHSRLTGCLPIATCLPIGTCLPIATCLSI